jgi:hypothetical protein
MLMGVISILASSNGTSECHNTVSQHHTVTFFYEDCSSDLYPETVPMFVLLHTAHSVAAIYIRMCTVPLSLLYEVYSVVGRPERVC